MQSILAGLAVLVLAAGAKYVLNRLWQGSLAEDADDAIQAAVDMGFKIMPLGFGPRIVAQGTINSVSVQVTWSGGLFGARSQVRFGDRLVDLPLITTEDALETVFGTEE